MACLRNLAIGALSRAGPVNLAAALRRHARDPARPWPPSESPADEPDITRERRGPAISAGQQSSAHPLRGLTARRFAYPVTALRYPDAGHLAGGLTVYLHSVTDDARTTSGGTQAAQADAHVRLIGRVSSAWWWPGMKLLTNGR
jgi:hypothetical protein